MILDARVNYLWTPQRLGSNIDDETDKDFSFGQEKFAGIAYY